MHLNGSGFDLVFTFFFSCPGSKNDIKNGEWRFWGEIFYFLQHQNADKLTVYQRFWLPYYTIPRIIRELQRVTDSYIAALDYTIPRIIRELQLLTRYRLDARQLYHTKNN